MSIQNPDKHTHFSNKIAIMGATPPRSEKPGSLPIESGWQYSNAAHKHQYVTGLTERYQPQQKSLSGGPIKAPLIAKAKVLFQSLK